MSYSKIIGCIILIVIALVFIAGNVTADSQQTIPTKGIENKPPQKYVIGPQKLSKSDNRGTDTFPIVVKMLDSQDAQEQAKEHKKEALDNSASNWSLVRITGGLLLIGILQLILFWRQLWLIRESLADAKIAADATSAVAHVIDRNGKQQMRAYISVLLAGEVPQNREIDWRYEVRMFVKNTGFTPAHAVNYEMRAILTDSILSDTFDLSLPVSNHEARGYIPSGQQNTIAANLPELITDEEINEMKYGTNLKLYVWGTIWYKDVFGEPHKTNFCQWGRWDIKGNFSTVNLHRHNDAN